MTDSPTANLDEHALEREVAVADVRLDHRPAREDLARRGGERRAVQHEAEPSAIGGKVISTRLLLFCMDNP